MNDQLLTWVLGAVAIVVGTLAKVVYSLWVDAKLKQGLVEARLEKAEARLDECEKDREDLKVLNARLQTRIELIERETK